MWHTLTSHELTWEVKDEALRNRAVRQGILHLSLWTCPREIGLEQVLFAAGQGREAFPLSAGSGGIGPCDILRSYLGLLAMGQSDYEAVTNRRKDDYFRDSLGIGNYPSAEILLQRLDGVGSGLRPLCDASTVEFLKKTGVAITPVDTGHFPLDCDFFAMDSSKTRKEGVSRIYNGEDGYAPIGAYLGRER
jgi:hypothetical protein